MYAFFPQLPQMIMNPQVSRLHSLTYSSLKRNQWILKLEMLLL